MTPNFLVIALAALIPLVIGFVWYNQAIGFGNAWIKASGVSLDKKSNMALVFGLTYVLGLLVAFAMLPTTIHQMGVYSTLAGEPGFLKDAAAASTQEFGRFMEQYGDRFRTFKHGAFHGTMMALCLAMPVLGINTLFERKGFKYFAINVGYWVITLALMGGVVCQWGTK